MTSSTEFPIGFGLFLVGDPISRRQGSTRSVKPMMHKVSTTMAGMDLELSNDTGIAGSESALRKFTVPMVDAAIPREVRADSAPLQIWEGTVIDVNCSDGQMQVLLDAKLGDMPRHTAEIDLDAVSPQDRDLVKPGAVFYLTLYKRSIPSVREC